MSEFGILRTMKFLFTIALSLWAALLTHAVTTLEEDFTCPIDRETWKQRIETSSRPAGLRLDLKKLGEVVEPRPCHNARSASSWSSATRSASRWSRR
jgi:hypothetical protein